MDFKTMSNQEKSDLFKNKFKELVSLKNKLENIEKVEVEFSEIELDNGNILSFEGELAVGVAVSIIVDGETSPATDGEYKMKDGKTLVIADGKVAEIKEAETNDEAPAEEALEEEVATPDTELKAEVDALKAELEALKAQLSELFNTVNAIGETGEVAMKKVIELSAQPAAQPIETKKVNISNNTDEQKKSDLKERFNRL